RETRYSRVPTSEGLSRSQGGRRNFDDYGPAGEDLRFRYDIPDQVPWKSILLAIALLLCGTIFIVISHLIFTAHIGGETSQAFGFLLLGILVFLPGFYETRIAYYSWRGFKGYSYSRIPAY
ncbi:hypothetical protein SELMODRAFT_69689, partial [Selaginella moellendorffii]